MAAKTRISLFGAALLAPLSLGSLGTDRADEGAISRSSSALARLLPRRSVVVVVALLGAVLGLSRLPAPALAARAATSREQADIRSVVLRQCRSQGCTLTGRAKVSTASSRYAIAAATGLPYSYSTILSRSNPRSRDWRVRLVIGGGAPTCAQLLAVLPGGVVADFKLAGLDAAGVFTEPCKTPPARARERTCKPIPTVTEGVRAVAKVRARGVTCEFARRIAISSSRGAPLPGRWTCLGSGEGSVCLPRERQRQSAEQVRRTQPRYVITDLTV